MHMKCLGKYKMLYKLKGLDYTDITKSQGKKWLVNCFPFPFTFS